jgi:hypothetical protein
MRSVENDSSRGRQFLVAVFLLLPCGVSLAQQQEINRALIQRDQQSAEFAAQLRGSQDRAQLETLHARQLSEALTPLSPDPAVASALLPYQRARMGEERVLRLAPPAGMPPAPRADVRSPLPLPGGPRPGVDPVTPESFDR